MGGASGQRRPAACATPAVRPGRAHSCFAAPSSLLSGPGHAHPPAGHPVPHAPQPLRLSKRPLLCGGPAGRAHRGLARPPVPLWGGRPPPGLSGRRGRRGGGRESRRGGRGRPGCRRQRVAGQPRRGQGPHAAAQLEVRELGGCVVRPAPARAPWHLAHSHRSPPPVLPRAGWWSPSPSATPSRVWSWGT